MEALGKTHDEWYALESWERRRWMSYHNAKRVKAGRLIDWLKVDGKHDTMTAGAVALIRYIGGDYA